MRLGRDFTNLLYCDYLSEEDFNKLKSGELKVPDMDALVQVRAKGDVIGQIAAAKRYGLDHVELDGAVPNPYLEMGEEEKRKIRETAKRENITLSLHLPYTYVGGSTCAPYETDRRMASELMKRYIDFASEIGCTYCNIHPGIVPFYHAIGKYSELIRNSLIKTLLELGEYAKERGLMLLVENNTAFDGCFFEPDELCSVVEEVRERGVEVYFNFDIGHWFTRADIGRPLPDPPERVVEQIPEGLFKALHLNDYVPGKRLFHPPLHEQLGPLKRENLIRYAEMVKRKGAELIVLETAFKTVDQVLNRDKIIESENAFVREIFG